MTNAEQQKHYCQKLKEKYSTKELRKKESEMCKGIANIEKIRKKDRERQQKYLDQKKKQEKLQLHRHTKVKVC